MTVFDSFIRDINYIKEDCQEIFDIITEYLDKNNITELKDFPEDLQEALKNKLTYIRVRNAFWEECIGVKQEEWFDGIDMS